MKKNLKILLIVILIIALVGSVIFCVVKKNGDKKSVNVVPLSYCTTTYWGDSLQSSGQVTADNAQVVYLTKNDKIAEVLVKEGDNVKEGDVLIRFDKKATQADEITAKELSIQKLKNDAHIDEIRLARIYATGRGIDWSKLKETNEYTRCIETVFTDREYGFEVARYITDINGENEVFVPGQYGDFTRAELEAGSVGDNSKFIKTVDTEATYLSTISYELEGVGLGDKDFNMDGTVKKDLVLDKRGYTQAQLDQMITSQERLCARNRINISRAEMELQTLKEKKDSGEVIAKVSGRVTKLQDIDSINYNSSFLVVTSSEGYYVAGGLGEMYLDTFPVGSVISCTNYITGGFSTAKIVEVESFPTNSFGSYSEGNRNASTYKFKAILDDMTGFEVGDYLDIAFQAGTDNPDESGNNLYLEKSMIRKDDSGSYVMIMDENERLKKQYVITGKTIWGSYLEIKQGLSGEGYIAFPYGKNVNEGVKCKISEML